MPASVARVVASCRGATRSGLSAVFAASRLAAAENELLDDVEGRAERAQVQAKVDHLFLVPVDREHVQRLGRLVPGHRRHRRQERRRGSWWGCRRPAAA